MSRPPLPPFTDETAAQKARMAEDAWNSRDPARVAMAYTPDSLWRNRAEFLAGRPALEAFLDEQAGQCGYCLSGILISAKALLAVNPSPTRTEIALALDGNICRCGSHNRILRAVEARWIAEGFPAAARVNALLDAELAAR